MPSSFDRFGGSLDTQQPPYGPAPAPLAGAELPSFRFPLGTVAPRTFKGGTAKEATVVEFPVSDKLAGVYMTLEPGALREMHWHANAAEWAYVIDGRCRVTTIDPENQAEIVDFGPGDVWYFPRGHGHSIQGLGPGLCTFVLVFDNGYFSEFGTFSISDWVGHTPPDVLARNFGVPSATFANFPKSEVYIAQGPAPAPLPQDPGPGSLLEPPLTHRYRLLAQAPETFPGGSMRIVSMRDFPISSTMTGALFVIKPGGMRELHWHPNAAEWQFYIRGAGRMAVCRLARTRPHWTRSAPEMSVTSRKVTAITSRISAMTISRWCLPLITAPISRFPLPPGSPPPPACCLPPISKCRKAPSQPSPKGK